jgi:hypothetical protein
MVTRKGYFSTSLYKLDENGRTDEGTHLVNSIQGPTPDGENHRDLPLKSNIPGVIRGYSFNSLTKSNYYDQINFN